MECNLYRRIGWGASFGFTLAVWMLSGKVAQGAENSSKQTPMRPPEEQEFGRLPDGGVVKLFTLRNGQGMVVKVMNYGAIMTQVQVPDRTGAVTNVILGA